MASREQERLAHIALSRFGLGAKPGGIARIAADPKAALIAELNTPGIALINPVGLPTYVQACNAAHRSFDAEESIRQAELTARIAKHMQPEIGFVERLVLFFSNHFSMSVEKDGVIRATIGQLERDIIRRCVLGRFEDMLLGVLRHPAMIRYLDNDDSIGPNSTTGRDWGVGLNHNLAREVFELHTMGVGGGYTEADINSVARILTGWSFVRGWEADNGQHGGTQANRGQFIFRPDWHEPGTQTVLGQTYPDTGLYQGWVFRRLAQHAATAQHIAFKLVQHFIADEPTPNMIQPVAAAYMLSSGNLLATARALIDLPEAWSAPLTKLRTPYELQIAEMRALQKTYPASSRWAFEEPLRALRHFPWQRSTPDGYPDESSYWSGPDAMRVRMETAQLNAWMLHEVPGYNPPSYNLAVNLFGSNLSQNSISAVWRTTNIYDGYTMVFSIPEFQRR